MKIRKGFVSNSSSSSFLVSYKNFDDEVILSQRDYDTLRKGGFKLSKKTNVSDYRYIREDEDNPVSLEYDISCNQDDVVYFLLYHDISFMASCHYDDYMLFYEKGTDYVVWLENHGLQYERSHFQDNKHNVGHPFYEMFMKEIQEVKPYKKIKKSSWLNDRINIEDNPLMEKFKEQS